MREIKFRGVHPAVDVIMDVCVIDWMHDEIFFEQGSDVSYSIDECKLMQFTGLTDINGVQIYEGDICEIMYYTPFGDKTDSFYGEWVVTKWMGQFILSSDKERLSFTEFSDVTSSEYVPNLGTVCDLSECVNVKVIGNIHQNKELLPCKQQ